MKVKIFNTTHHPIAVENGINEFIKDKTVVFVKQTESLSCPGFSFSISVWYEEQEPEYCDIVHDYAGKTVGGGFGE